MISIFAPERIREIDASQRTRGLLQPLADRREDGLPANLGPVDAKTVILQDHASGSVVVGHDEISLGISHRAKIRTAGQTLQLLFSLLHEIGRIRVNSVRRSGSGKG